MDISCVVLAGGKGLRLGRDKALETVGNKTLLQRVVSHLSVFNCDIIIVTAGEQSLSRHSDYPGSRIVADIHPGRGALGGIYTGLVSSRTLYNLVVACDMPFLNHELLIYLIQVAPGFDAVVPRLGKMVEPLHAVYSKECLGAIESLLGQEKLDVNRLLSLVRVRYVEAEEIDRIDPVHLSFFNINTQADLNKARSWSKG